MGGRTSSPFLNAIMDSLCDALRVPGVVRSAALEWLRPSRLTETPQAAPQLGTGLPGLPLPTVERTEALRACIRRAAGVDEHAPCVMITGLNDAASGRAHAGFIRLWDNYAHRLQQSSLLKGRVALVVSQAHGRAEPGVCSGAARRERLLDNYAQEAVFREFALQGLIPVIPVAFADSEGARMECDEQVRSIYTGCRLAPERAGVVDADADMDDAAAFDRHNGVHCVRVRVPGRVVSSSAVAGVEPTVCQGIKASFAHSVQFMGMDRAAQMCSRRWGMSDFSYPQPHSGIDLEALRPHRPTALMFPLRHGGYMDVRVRPVADLLEQYCPPGVPSELWSRLCCYDVHEDAPPALLDEIAADMLQATEAMILAAMDAQ